MNDAQIMILGVGIGAGISVLTGFVIKILARRWDYNKSEVEK